MHVGDPLFVLTPTFDHGHLGLFTDIEDPDGAVTVASTEDISGYLIGG